MNDAAATQWRDEFGLPDIGGDVFFTTKTDSAVAATKSSQRHVGYCQVKQFGGILAARRHR